MAINKDAFLRYQVLDRCFRNTGRYYFMGDLIEECSKALQEYNGEMSGINRRQIYYDINFMESDQGWSIPLERIPFGRKVAYRYSDSSFSINNQPLNDSEVEHIKAALQIFTRFSGAPQFEWIHEMIPLLESKFGLVERKSEVIKFESNVDLVGINFLQPLFNAIINERVLNISYQDFSSPKPYSLLFHPYYLKQYNNRWFVFGYNQQTQSAYWNLALDRIISIAETDGKYIPSSTDWEDYFYNIVGVTRPVDGVVEEVVLHFNQAVAPYVKTKPIHGTQKDYNNSQSLEIKLQVIPNFELETLILSFGNNVEVISPPELRHKIAERLKEANERYLKNVSS